MEIIDLHENGIKPAILIRVIVPASKWHSK